MPVPREALEPVAPGTPLVEAVTSARLNGIAKALEYLASGAFIKVGPGLTLDQSSGDTGVVIRLGRRTVEGGATAVAATEYKPFDPVITTAAAEDTDADGIPDGPPRISATIRPGTVNNILATNWSTPFVVNTSETYYLKTNVLTQDAEVTTHSLVLDSTPPPAFQVAKGAPPVSFSVLLGIILNGVWYRTIGPGSLMATSVEAFRTSKEEPAPGTLPYDIWYSWSVSAS